MPFKATVRFNHFLHSEPQRTATRKIIHAAAIIGCVAATVQSSCFAEFNRDESQGIGAITCSMVSGTQQLDTIVQPQWQQVLPTFAQACFLDAARRPTP